MLRATADKGVDADLVEAAKLRAISRAEFQKTSIPGLASAWSEALAVEGRQSPSDEVAAIQRVTVADVNRASDATSIRHASRDHDDEASGNRHSKGRGEGVLQLHNTNPVRAPAGRKTR